MLQKGTITGKLMGMPLTTGLLNHTKVVSNQALPKLNNCARGGVWLG